eukprot:CAMPEP_0175029878 /NCGR_PEP_ID=MMETSP0005-20121125/19867_1 /TAXON_ID=420556 /ORGANISM="Ochromonas sp., Strain CCMP1393" /LENGTH=63 /DNA_ID=CAMNT_0016289791 /DNA_START=352 /DNA_END=540 /DNA_ORIENTATION=+
MSCASSSSPLPAASLPAASLSAASFSASFPSFPQLLSTPLLFPTTASLTDVPCGGTGGTGGTG